MTTAFVLGGGGVLGDAEAGQALALSEAGIVPDVVCGTSIGAINGAYIAMDPSPDGIEKLADLWMTLTDDAVFAEEFDSLKALKKADEEKKTKDFEAVWKSIRKDGAYVEAGENDNVIVEKLVANKDAFGIFGYSFLEENTSKLAGISVEGVAPTYENISAGKYKGARDLFIYVKKQHVGVIAGLDKFVAEYVSDKAIGEDGYLAKKGLVALPKAAIEASRKGALAMATIKGDDLK